MRFAVLTAPALALLALSACDSAAEQEAEATEDRIEQEAATSAAAAGDAVAALGLTERQLLDADLRTVDGTELGDVAQVRRDASGAVTDLLVEVEDSNPDRYVLVSVDGLTTRADGNETDLQTTRNDLAAMPDAMLETAGGTPKPTTAAQ